MTMHDCVNMVIRLVKAGMRLEKALHMVSHAYMIDYDRLETAYHEEHQA